MHTENSSWYFINFLQNIKAVTQLKGGTVVNGGVRGEVGWRRREGRLLRVSDFEGSDGCRPDKKRRRRRKWKKKEREGEGRQRGKWL